MKLKRFKVDEGDTRELRALRHEQNEIAARVSILEKQMRVLTTRAPRIRT